MTVRQRVSSVLENESFIVESIETQFSHLNGVEDVVGGLERVKFCYGVHFLALQNCQKVYYNRCHQIATDYSGKTETTTQITPDEIGIAV